MSGVIERILEPGFVAGLGKLPMGEVRARRDLAAQEETDLSYLRRLLHARIDIVRAEALSRAFTKIDAVQNHIQIPVVGFNLGVLTLGHRVLDRQHDLGAKTAQ